MLNLSAFGKNDIRGIYGEDITEELFYYTGRGFVKYLTKQTGKENNEIWITVCRDARLHSPALSKALVEGILSTGANVVGSIPMGWGRNPWTEKNEGEIFTTPEDTKNTILGIKERFAGVENPTNMIVLTCWDEYGEGHFYAPTRVQGFGYLNAVREAVTAAGPKQTEELPTAKALARMDSLNPGSRRAAWS